jgi:hypothetical protein
MMLIIDGMCSDFAACGMGRGKRMEGEDWKGEQGDRPGRWKSGQASWLRTSFGAPALALGRKKAHSLELKRGARQFIGATGMR